MEDLIFAPQIGGDLTQFGGPRMPGIRSMNISPQIYDQEQPIPPQEPTPISKALQVGGLGMKGMDFVAAKNATELANLGLLGGEGYTMPHYFAGLGEAGESRLVNMYKTKPQKYLQSKMSGPYSSIEPGRYLTEGLDKLDFSKGITAEELKFMGEDFALQLPDSVLQAGGTSKADLVARHLKFRNPNITAHQLSQPIANLPGATGLDLATIAPNTPTVGPWASKFTPQVGQAQGPGMQILKAFGQTQAKGGPGFFKTLFPKASGLGAGTNTGLLAGMGPAGWTMMALGLLGGAGSGKVFKKGTFMDDVLKIFSDKRLKENIVKVGKSFSGTNIYEFNYKGKEGRYRGVISDEVPWAVTMHKSGYEMVDYNKIDVGFKKVG